MHSLPILQGGRPYCADGPHGLQTQPLWPVTAVERRHGPKQTEFREGLSTVFVATNLLVVEVRRCWWAPIHTAQTARNLKLRCPC